MSVAISFGSGMTVGVDVRDVERFPIISFTRVLCVTFTPASYVGITVFNAKYSALLLEAPSAVSAE